jgi:hypothetical protein
MANLYDKAGLVNIPVGYQDGFLYNIKPEDNTLGFRFNRDSAATRVNKEGLIEQVGYFGPELVQNGNFSEIGPELVTNGDFTTNSNWTKYYAGDNNSITIANGVLSFDSNTNQNVSQSISSSNLSGFYKITYTITSYTRGNPHFLLGGGSNIYLGFETGTFTKYVQGGGINSNFVLYGGIYGQGGEFSIDNVSVKQVDPNDYWTLGNGWSIGDGKLKGDNATGYAIQSGVFAAGVSNIYKINLTVSDYVSGYFTILTGGGTSQSQQFNANGNYTIYLNTNNPSNSNFHFTYFGAFTGSIDNVSVVEVKGDKPRIDYTDSLTSPSFLLEPQSTNLITFSEDFSQWTNYSQGTGSLVTLTSNYSISPDGTKNASRIQCALNGGNTSSDRSYIKLSGFSGTPFTCAKSLYVKNNLNVEQTFFIGVNAVSDRVILPVSNKWQRLKVEGGVLNTEFRIGIIGASLNSDSIDIDIFAAQAEALSYATSYIPTAGSKVTRAQETCNGAGSASTFNSTEGVLYAEMAALADDGTYRQILLHDSSYNNRIALRYMPTSNQINVYLYNGTVQSEFYYNLSNVLDFNKIAFKYQQNNFSLYVNGVEVGADTSGTTFSANTLQKVDFDFENNYFFYGKIKGVYVFNEALTDDELQQLTGPEYNSFAALAAAYNYTVI